MSADLSTAIEQVTFKGADFLRLFEKTRFALDRILPDRVDL